MEVIRETLWKRCLSTPAKPPARNSNICLSETAYQHKGTRKKCKKTNQGAIIQWQRQYLMGKPNRSRKQATFLSRVPVHWITPFCSDALASPPNLYPPCQKVFSMRLGAIRLRVPLLYFFLNISYNINESLANYYGQLIFIKTELSIIILNSFPCPTGSLLLSYYSSFS